MTTLTTIAISLVVAIIAFGQFRIADTKTKLEFYEKRLAILLSASEAARRTYLPFDPEQEDFKDLHNAVRESRFLFDPEDKVEELMKAIQLNVAVINLDRRSCFEANGKAPSNPDLAVRLFLNAQGARADLTKNIDQLEEILEKYNRFKTVSGWTWAG